MWLFCGKIMGKLFSTCLLYLFLYLGCRGEATTTAPATDTAPSITSQTITVSTYSTTIAPTTAPPSNTSPTTTPASITTTPSGPTTSAQTTIPPTATPPPSNTSPTTTPTSSGPTTTVSTSSAQTTIPPITTPATVTTTTPTTTTTVITTTTLLPTPHDLSSPFTWKDTDVDPKHPYVIVKTDPGYSSISVKVSNVKNMLEGSYLRIQGGEIPDNQTTDGRVFTNDVKGPLLYLFKATSVYASCYISKTNKQNYTFTVDFEQIEDAATTVTDPPTTEISWPTTEKGDSIYLTVNVSGKSLEEYSKTKTVDAFKTCVVEMATSYCQQVNIHLNETITNKNVVLKNIERCPYSWPDSDDCVRIRFKLPIYYIPDNRRNDYELNAEHLELMWLRYSGGKCFSDNGFSEYEEPDFATNITWWAVGISIVIALFIILLWFLKTYSSQFRSKLRKRNQADSDTRSIISSKKDSLISLAPHYLQDHMDTPKFFET